MGEEWNLRKSEDESLCVIELYGLSKQKITFFEFLKFSIFFLVLQRENH